MKFVFSIVCLSAFVWPGYAQKSEEILATATGYSFNSNSLSADGRKIFENQNEIMADARRKLFSHMLNEILLELESKSRKIPVDSLVSAETKKIPKSTQAEIQSVYNANRSSIGEKSLEAVRPEIAAFLRRQAEEKAMQILFENLKAKHKVVYGKDVNAANLQPLESLVTVGGRPISVREFEEENKAALYDARAEIADEIKSDLESTILSTLVNEEAKAKNTDASSIIATEVTDKLREFSEAERAELISAFRNRLFIKYAVKLLLKEPEVFVQNIAIDDDPVRGKPEAAATVVMFSDFQCSACAAAHPVVKNILAEYPGKVRFVVRDYPLTSIHENAFQAALAANAANAQGKFFEYIELLYVNQGALDINSLKKYAAHLGLNVKRFELDLTSEKAAAEVRKDIADGTSYGIQGTPTIFVNGVKVRRFSADSFRVAIEKVLKK